MLVRKISILVTVFIVITSFNYINTAKRKPTLFLIGDSTVKNGKGDGGGGLWGWGDLIANYFDTTKIKIENHALGGTSSRTFISKGLWNKALNKMQKGDYLMLQFGHNDSSPINDTSRARGTIKGIGDTSVLINNQLSKQPETVHTYGWYLTKIISEAKAKGVNVIVCSPIPRNDWKDGKVIRGDKNTYGLWAQQTANATKSLFIDLHKLTADYYDEIGQEKVVPFFPKEHVHTGKEGANINAQNVCGGLKLLKKCKLNKYLKK